MNTVPWREGPWWYAQTTPSGYAAGVGDEELTKPLAQHEAALIALAPEMAEAIQAWHAAGGTQAEAQLAEIAAKINAIINNLS